MTTTYVLIALFLLLSVSVVSYAMTTIPIISQISMAVFTSLLATILMTFFDLFVKYRNFEHTQFIDNLYSFGIHNLHFDKKTLLQSLIKDAHEQIWVSGYRLILTVELSRDILSAIERRIDVRILACPPWSEAYGLVYGEGTGIIDNYLALFKVMTSYSSLSEHQIEVRFSDTPLFNDTYRVDNKIVTSPYMHNRDVIFGTMTAHDFFTYELDKNYRLYHLMEDEYTALWDQSNGARLTVAAMKMIVEETEHRDLTQKEKCDLVQRHMAVTEP